MPPSVAQIKTNRDLYLHIVRLAKVYSDSDRSLEQYLLVLWAGVSRHSGESWLDVSVFCHLLGEAFEARIPYAEEEEQLVRAASVGAEAGYYTVADTLMKQVADLRAMQQAGTLDDEYRYFGVDAPSGALWYNFDPLTYLECAVSGTFGGWEEGDDSGRVYVPGKVAVLDSSGALVEVDPRDIQSVECQLEPLDWATVDDFLWCGQAYE